MRLNASLTALIVAIALCASSCSTSRPVATSAVSSSKFQVSSARDSLVVQSVEVHDTLREVTTITVDRNDKGDTLRQSIVTDRERIRNAVDVRSETVEVRVIRDTVYIERRDSLLVSSSKFQGSGSLNPHPSPLTYIKWIFAILCAIIVLIITLKVCLRRLF